mmetsp:Transcript_21231/g.56699  ORF Transcript_21231/g.56699 Transcript_21231/m.56699 type:complete len:230 (+) Transcript_21231:887-1576(+)
MRVRWRRRLLVVRLLVLAVPSAGHCPSTGGRNPVDRSRVADVQDFRAAFHHSLIFGKCPLHGFLLRAKVERPWRREPRNIEVCSLSTLVHRGAMRFHDVESGRYRSAQTTAEQSTQVAMSSADAKGLRWKWTRTQTRLLHPHQRASSSRSTLHSGQSSTHSSRGSMYLFRMRKTPVTLHLQSTRRCACIRHPLQYSRNQRQRKLRNDSKRPRCLPALSASLLLWMRAVP